MYFNTSNFLFVAILFYCANVVRLQKERYKLCVVSADLCKDFVHDDVECIQVPSPIDCALKMSRTPPTAHLGVFSGEETLLLAQEKDQLKGVSVVATIKNTNYLPISVYEFVAIVRANHTGGLGGLHGAHYCHPGLERTTSQSVAKALELAATKAEKCPNVTNRSAEELEVETLASYFTEACRPGSWSANEKIDAELKKRHPKLCALCGPKSNCSRYVVSGTEGNTHFHALDCLRTAHTSNSVVAYVTWEFAIAYFGRLGDEWKNYGVLCKEGTLIPLTNAMLYSSVSPCEPFIRQPHRTIIAASANASKIFEQINIWFPLGNKNGKLYDIVAGKDKDVIKATKPLTPLDYTSTMREVQAIERSLCPPAPRWCTISSEEHNRCNWIRAAAHSLGIKPTISCEKRTDIFDCLKAIQDKEADFVVSSTNYGYIVQQRYSNLSPIKFVQSFSRMVALVKKNPVKGREIKSFADLKNKTACFPEYGGLGFMAFIRIAKELKVINSSESDYSRAAAGFFAGACAPGALDLSHNISQSDLNVTKLCTSCKPVAGVEGKKDVFCAANASNKFFGDRGALDCLADSGSDVAFVQLDNIKAHLSTAEYAKYRVVCRNGSLVDFQQGVDDKCLLAKVVGAEVIARSGDPQNQALVVLLETIDKYFGKKGTKLIDLKLFGAFDDENNVIFKDTATGFVEPKMESSKEAMDYIKLLNPEAADAASTTTPASTTVPATTPASFAGRSYVSVVTFFVTALVARIVV